MMKSLSFWRVIRSTEWMTYLRPSIRESTIPQLHWDRWHFIIIIKTMKVRTLKLTWSWKIQIWRQEDSWGVTLSLVQLTNNQTSFMRNTMGTRIRLIWHKWVISRNLQEWTLGLVSLEAALWMIKNFSSIHIHTTNMTPNKCHRVSRTRWLSFHFTTTYHTTSQHIRLTMVTRTTQARVTIA